MKTLFKVILCSTFFVVTSCGTTKRNIVEERETLTPAVDEYKQKLEGSWYLLDGMRAIRFDFHEGMMTLSNRELFPDSEEYVPVQEMRVTMLSESRLQLDVESLILPIEGERKSVNRENAFEMAMNEHGMDRESAELMIEELFDSVVLDYTIKEDGVLSLTEEGQETNNLIPYPPVIHDPISGSR